MNTRLVALVIALAAAGCTSNPYKEFYRSAPGMEAPKSVAGYDTNITALQIYASKDFNADVQALARRGYAIIGESAFNAGEELMTDEALRAQAKLVGAQIVLLSSKYTHTVNGVQTLTVPTTTTSHTTGTAKVYGSGGSATVYGTATTTTLGSETIAIPYTQRRFNSDVLYFARFKVRFGAQVGSLTDEMRKARGSNQGVMVVQVIEGTPAFAADFFPGDIILSLNGRPVSTPQEFVAFTRDPNNHDVTVELVRDNKPLQKRLTMTDLPPAAPAEKQSGTRNLLGAMTGATLVNRAVVAFVSMALVVCCGLARGDDSLASLDLFNPSWGVVFPGEKARVLMLFNEGEVEGTWTPSARDIATLEPLLAAQFGRTRDVDGRKMDLPGYPKNFYRQYGGVVVGGRRLIAINGFHKDFVAETIRDGAAADFWKHDVVAVKDGGCWFFHATFDVAARAVRHLACQGNG